MEGPATRGFLLAMKFSIAIYGSPGSTQASDTAFRFATALLAQGHSLYRIFFYRDGVHNASSLIAAPQDETDLTAKWQELALNYNIDMVVCIAAALRRGIINSEESERYDKSNHNLAAGFELGGLGQLLDAAVISDRLITFGS
jgi:tRNA 2-thiouridine synthesizing protein D